MRSYLQGEAVQDEGLPPDMLPRGVGGLLDVGALAHPPPEVVQGQRGPLLDAWGARTLLVQTGARTLLVHGALQLCGRGEETVLLRQGLHAPTQVHVHTHTCR